VKVGAKRKMKDADYQACIAETVNLPGGGTGKGANYYNFRKKT
jgi:hypothetical protein